MPYNKNKAQEHGKAAYKTPAGMTVEPDTPAATGSTLTESNASDKTEARASHRSARIHPMALSTAYESIRPGQALTTNQGTPVADNQNSLKAGFRGPTLLEDFILREKITHFDHERIPERIVHARGSAAHGFFESYDSLAKDTRLSVLRRPENRRPSSCVSLPL